MVDIHASEEEQVQAIKDWLRQYGLFIVIGLVIGVGGVFGVRAWDSHKLEQAQQASTRYSEITDIAKAGDFTKVKEQTDALKAEFPTSPYATQAALSMAALALDEDQADEAKAQLEWVLSSDAIEPMKHVARLRLARVALFVDKDADAAAKLVDADVDDAFEPLFQELRGDIFVAKEDFAAAREQYDLALANWDDDMGSDSLLRMKRDDIAGK